MHPGATVDVVVCARVEARRMRLPDVLFLVLAALLIAALAAVPLYLGG